MSFANLWKDVSQDDIIKKINQYIDDHPKIFRKSIYVRVKINILYNLKFFLINIRNQDLNLGN